MADVPRTQVKIPLRCQEAVGARPRAFCGQAASWLRPGSAVFMPGFYCDDHHKSGDVAIPADVVFRRVRIQADISFAGVTSYPAESHADAVERVRQAIEQAGGVFNLLDVGSAVVRYVEPAPPEKGIGGRGREL